MRSLGRLEIIFLIISIQALGNKQAAIATEPFTIKRVVFINGSSESFGDYKLKSTNIFEEGDNLSLYFEPENCTLSKNGRGYKAQIQGTAVLSSVTNPSLTQTLDLGRMEFVIPNQDIQMYADITLMDVGKLPIDLYELKMTLTDFSSKSAYEFSKKFRVGPTYIQAMVAATNSTIFDPKLKTFPVFPADSSKIFCLYKPRRVPDGSQMRSILIAESVEGFAPETNIESLTVEVKRFKEGNFLIEGPEGGWKAGNYRLEFFMNDIFEIALFFRVK